MSHLFFKQREENPNECYSDEEIMAEFTTFVIAGMDTTGHLLIMTIYYLIHNPEVKEKVLKEMKAIFPNGTPSEFTSESLGKLDYTNAVLKETLRMSSPAPGNSL